MKSINQAYKGAETMRSTMSDFLRQSLIVERCRCRLSRNHTTPTHPETKALQSPPPPYLVEDIGTQCNSVVLFINT